MQCLICGNDFDPDLRTCPVCAERGKTRGGFATALTRLEDALLSILLAVMVLMVLSQIVLRYAFQTGMTGGDSLVRHLVIWIAFFGASIAARSGAHVKIDVLTRVLPASWHRWLVGLTDLFSFAVCALLVYASVQFLHIEYQSEGTSVFMDVPVWIMEIIIPFGYAIIAIRFGHRAVSALFSGKGENKTW